MYSLLFLEGCWWPGFIVGVSWRTKVAAGPAGFPGLWEGLQPCPRCVLTHSWMKPHWLSELHVSVAHPSGGSLKSWAVDVGWSVSSGRCWELAISQSFGAIWGWGSWWECVSASPVLFHVGYLLTRHVWEPFWISLNGIAPCVGCVFGAPVGTGTIYFLNLIEALYDYPIVYLMLVLVISSSLLRSSKSWSCYTTYCIGSPIGLNIVFSVFFIFYFFKIN